MFGWIAVLQASFLIEDRDNVLYVWLTKNIITVYHTWYENIDRMSYMLQYILCAYSDSDSVWKTARKSSVPLVLSTYIHCACSNIKM